MGQITRQSRFKDVQTLRDTSYFHHKDSPMIQFVKANAVLLALVALILYQQSELKEVERTLNYIYAAVQTNNTDILETKEEVWAVSDLLVAVYEEEAAAAE